MGSWQDPLRLARERQGLSRAELARRASLSVDTVRAYEQGRRSPTNASLTAILDALKLDRTEANNIRLALGFAPDHRDFGTPSIADQFPVAAVEGGLECRPRPAFARAARVRGGAGPRGGARGCQKCGHPYRTGASRGAKNRGRSQAQGKPFVRGTRSCAGIGHRGLVSDETRYPYSDSVSMSKEPQ